MSADGQFDFNFAGPLALMTVDEVYERASVELFCGLREDRRIERKHSTIHADALGDYFSMWANTSPDGGVLVIGMENDGTISGCTNLNINQLNAIEKTGMVYCPEARFESKRVEATNREGTQDFLLVFRIHYRNDRVVRTTSGSAFVREGESKRRLSEEQIRELEIDKGQIDFELEPCQLDYPRDFDCETVRLFAEKYGKARGLSTHSDEEILELARLGKIQGSAFIPNMACALLFANDPRVRFPGCFVRFLRFEGETEGTGEKFNVVKDLRIEGNISKQILAAEEAIRSQLREFSRLGKDGKFFTAPEYPGAAWYEALVNACVHRSYSIRAMNIFVKMFDDRLEVESPGGFPPLVTPENIYEVHRPRNPHLMEALFYLDFVKCAHEGTRRMRETMRAMNLPAPEFRQADSAVSPLVRVVLRNNVKQRRAWVDSDVSAIVGEAVTRTLSVDEKRAVNFVAEYEQISVSDLQRLTQRSWPSAKNLLTGLVSKKILIHIVDKGKERDPQARYVLRFVARKVNGDPH